MFKQTGGDAFDSYLIKKYGMTNSDFLAKPQAEQDRLRKEFVDGGSVSGVRDVYIAPAGVGNQPIVNCNSRAECDTYGKDDIENELLRRGFTQTRKPNRMAGPKEFSDGSTKPELVNILLNHNKREMARLSYLQKQTGRSIRGSFPSEATNPSMYDHTSGLLRPEYLTQDHHGLTAYDFKGDKYQVFFQPKLNGFGGNAIWKKISGEGGALNPCDPLGNCRSLPPGLVLDSRGLPILSQLNYVLHYGLSYRGKDDKMYILAPKKRKDLKNFSVHPTNAVPEKNGNIQMHWVLANAHPWTTEPVAKGADEQKFYLPDGSVVTGKELNKLSLEQIWRMMMLLELMDPATQRSNYEKMRDVGIGPFAPKKNDGTTLGGAKRTRTFLNASERAMEEQKYLNANLPQCGALDAATGKITPANRCYTDSRIPGACVPHEEICFNIDYQGYWKNSDRYGNNETVIGKKNGQDLKFGEWASEKMTELEQAGALESEAAYRQWKDQKDQAKVQDDYNQRWGARGGPGDNLGSLRTIDTSNVMRARIGATQPPVTYSGEKPKIDASELGHLQGQGISASNWAKTGKTADASFN